MMMDNNIRILYLDETASTNDVLRDVALSAPDEIVVAVADYQTAGRGQGGNAWESQRGKNLLFSLKMQPVAVPVTRQFLLSMAMALAIKKTLDVYADGFTLKWPNDIYWNDCKISGTLIETSISGRGISSCIFGVGIDVNQRHFLGGAPNPISLSTVTGQEHDRRELLFAVLENFKYYNDMLAEHRYDEIVALYQAAMYRREGMHRFSDAGGNFSASIVRVEPNGRLVLCDSLGNERGYYFKEVRWEV